MKKMSIIFILMFLFCQQQSSIIWQDGSWSNTSDDGKLIMVDFWGTTCRPCHRLFDETFVNPDIVTFANTHFNSYKIDAWLKENFDIKKEYQIKGVPTLVFIDSDGQEVDRLVGFRPAEEMLKEWQRIVDGIETYPTLKKAVEENPKNVDKLIQLAKKLNGMRSKGDEETVQVWATIQNVLPSSDLQYEQASIQLAIHKMWADQDPMVLEKKAKNVNSFENQELALKSLIDFGRDIKNEALEAKYYKQLAAAYVQNIDALDATTVAYRLNGYAWRMTELESNLPDALEKIQFGLSVLPEDSDVGMKSGQIDTEAEVLWKLGRSNEAIEAIDKCIALEPNNEYFQKQKEKFFTEKDVYQ